MMQLTPRAHAVLLMAAKMRVLDSRDNTATHKAADAHLNAMMLAVNYGFLKGKQAVDKVALKSATTERQMHEAVDGVPKAIRTALMRSLPKALGACLSDSGQKGMESIARMKRIVSRAALANHRALGDVEGHEFHGNQWTHGGAVLSPKEEAIAKKYGDIGPYKVKPVIGDDPKPTTVAESLKREANVLHWNLQQMTPGRTSTADVQKRLDGLHEHIARLEPKASRHLADSKFPTKFDATSEEAIKWAREHAAELAEGISDTSRDDIRDAIASALEGEGLDSAYDDILDAVGNEARAEMISRTETMDAANEGLAQSWDQAVSDGLLTGNEKKVWIATSGCCDECDEVDGEEVPMDDDFSVGDDPPLHPNCRCTMGLVGE